MTIKNEYKIQKDGKQVVISLEKVDNDKYEINRDGSLLVTLQRDFENGNGFWYTDLWLPMIGNQPVDYEEDLNESMQELVEEIELGEFDNVDNNEVLEQDEN